MNDPDGQNEMRADAASAALTAFARAVAKGVSGPTLRMREGDETMTTDLLCNLMHLADRGGFDFDAALDSARGHYRAETTEPDDIEMAQRAAPRMGD